jgi:hypothetical protein
MFAPESIQFKTQDRAYEYDTSFVSCNSKLILSKVSLSAPLFVRRFRITHLDAGIITKYVTRADICAMAVMKLFYGHTVKYTLF